MAFTWPSKGERTPSSRAGGEQRSHGDSAGALDQKIWSARALRPEGATAATSATSATHSYLSNRFEPLEKDVIAIKYVYD